MRRTCALAVVLLGATSLLAQSYTFEVASVKPARPDNPPGQGLSRAPGGRFTAVNAPVRFLILYAYQLQGYQLIGAPDWIATERFDIVAKMAGDPPSIVTAGPDPMRLATRTLLADRFGLVVRGETRELDIYALTMAKPGGQPGPALTPSPDDCSVMAARARAAAPTHAERGRYAALHLWAVAWTWTHPVRRLPTLPLRQWSVANRRQGGGRSHRPHRELGLRAHVRSGAFSRFRRAEPVHRDSGAAWTEARRDDRAGRRAGRRPRAAPYS